jgi:hypothetical protein
MLFAYMDCPNGFTEAINLHNIGVVSALDAVKVQ